MSAYRTSSVKSFYAGICQYRSNFKSEAIFFGTKDARFPVHQLTGEPLCRKFAASIVRQFSNKSHKYPISFIAQRKNVRKKEKGSGRRKKEKSIKTIKKINTEHKKRGLKETLTIGESIEKNQVSLVKKISNQNQAS